MIDRDRQQTAPLDSSTRVDGWVAREKQLSRYAQQKRDHRILRKSDKQGTLNSAAGRRRQRWSKDRAGLEGAGEQTSSDDEEIVFVELGVLGDGGHGERRDGE